MWRNLFNLVASTASVVCESSPLFCVLFCLSYPGLLVPVMCIKLVFVRLRLGARLSHAKFL